MKSQRIKNVQPTAKLLPNEAETTKRFCWRNKFYILWTNKTRKKNASTGGAMEDPPYQCNGQSKTSVLVRQTAHPLSHRKKKRL